MQGRHTVDLRREMNIHVGHVHHVVGVDDRKGILRAAGASDLVERADNGDELRRPRA